MMMYFDYFSKWVTQTTHEPQSLDVEMHPQKSWTNGKRENDGFENDSPFPAADFFRFHLINFRGVWETNIVTIIMYVSVLCEMTTGFFKPPNKNSDAKKFPLLLMRQAQLEAMELEKQREKEARYSSKRQNDLTNGTIWRGIMYPTIDFKLLVDVRRL